ncbi:sensor histidine kinase [Paenibacillus sp. MBLB4367]|uniref:sensor histidine kinase n=1 Tax=Paenibacillus sp. MBLB4367 TaxID=3384767 RepID=UPI003907E985
MAYYRRLSIRSQLSFIAVSIACVMLFIIFITYVQISGIINAKNKQYTQEMIAQIKQTVHANKDVIDRLMSNVAFHQDVQNFLTEEDVVQSYTLSKRLSSLFINMRSLKDGILDIIIYGENGRWLDIAGGKKLTAQYSKSITAKDSIHYFGLQNFGSAYQSENGVLIGMKIKYFQSGERFNTVIGTLFFVVDPKALIGESGTISKQINTQSYLIDKENKVMSSSDPSQVGLTLNIGGAESEPGEQRKTTVNGVNYVLQTESLPEINGSIVSMVPEKELHRDISKIRKTELIVFLIGAVIMLILFMLVINNILLPLKKLMAYMSAVKHGHLDKLKNRIELQGYVEITVMSNEFNGMMDKIDNLTHQLLETNAMLYGAELEKQKSELAFLRSQINPHFLYNTLEVIKGMAAVKKVPEIREIAKALGQIFRYSVKGEDTVTLKTEFGIIESYVQIQQLRFAGRFQVRYELAEETLDCQIPKMLVQPIVENAVFHGLEPNENLGTLTIASCLGESGELIISVEDNGLGIEPDRLARVRGILSKPNAVDQEGNQQFTSIGLANVNNRIRLTYGGNFGLEVESTLGIGTRIVLKLPARRNGHV